MLSVFPHPTGDVYKRQQHDIDPVEPGKLSGKLPPFFAMEEIEYDNSQNAFPVIVEHEEGCQDVYKRQLLTVS